MKPLRKTMAARLPLPAELDAALNAAPRFKKSSVVPQTIESKADPHAFERQLLDDVLGGGGGAPRPPRAAAAAAPDADLLASMASKLSGLEHENRALRQQASARDRELSELRKENAQLDSAVESAAPGGVEQLRVMRRLQRQIHEMEGFLADYGLVWVGGGEDDEDDESTVAPDAAEAGAPKAGGAAEAGAAEAGAAEAAPIEVNFDLLMRRVNELNTVVEADRMRMVRDGNKARFELPPSEKITVFRNGLMVREGPFRPFSATSAQQVVRDICDGFFPTEFKERYPAGVPLDVRDRRHDVFEHADAADGTQTVAFSGAGHQLGRKVKTLADMGSAAMELPGGGGAEGLLRRLPPSVVHNGRVVDIRANVRKRLDAAAPPRDDPSAASNARVADTPALHALQQCVEDDETGARAVLANDAHSQITSLQVRVDGDGGRILFKMRFGDTVGALRHEIDKVRGASTAYEVRTAFPNRAYSDAAQTLLDAGLTPSANVHLLAL